MTDNGSNTIRQGNVVDFGGHQYYVLEASGEFYSWDTLDGTVSLTPPDTVVLKRVVTNDR